MPATGARIDVRFPFLILPVFILVFVSGPGADAAITLAQTSNGNILVTFTDDMGVGRVYCPPLQLGGLNPPGLILHKHAILSNISPPVWDYFGTRGAATDVVSGINRNYATDDTPLVFRLGSTQSTLPIDISGAKVILKNAPAGGTYSIYQLRTSVVPGALPQPVAVGAVDDAPTNGDVKTVDVALNNIDGAYLYVRVLKSDNQPALTEWIGATHTGAPVLKSGTIEAAVLVYGSFTAQSPDRSFMFPGTSHPFTSATHSTMAAAVGDVIVVHPVAAVPGAVLHATHPTVVRYGAGPAPGTGFPLPTTDIATPSGKIQHMRPLYDIAATRTPVADNQLLIPKQFLPADLATRWAGQFYCRHDNLDFSESSGGTFVQRLGSGFVYTPARLPAPASDDRTPTAPLYTGVFGTGPQTVVPGTGGLVTVSSDIHTPLFPAAPATPPAQPTAPFGAFGTTQRSGQSYVFATIPVAQTVSGWDCELTDRLFPGGYTGAESTAAGVRTFLFALSGTPLEADAVGFQNYSGTLRLSCAVGLSSGTSIEHRTIELGTADVLGPGAQQFLAAYQDDTFGWGAPDFLGLGLVGVMGIFSAMVGFSRKNLPASAVIFASVIGALGWFGIMEVSEVVMSGIVVATILLVFQRSGAR